MRQRQHPPRSKSQLKRARRLKRGQRPLRLEALEPRRLFAIDVLGTDQADVIRVAPIDGTDLIVWRNDVEVFRTAIGAKITIDAGEGDDLVEVSDQLTHAVRVFGGPGNDHLIGGRGDDFLDGGPGDDRIEGRGGSDRISGGDGDDQLFGDLAHVDNVPVVSEFDGDDVIDGGNGNDDIRGGSDDDWLTGGDGDDAIHGERGDDVLFGSDGDDFLRGGKNDDVIEGGKGKDTAYGDGNDDRVRGGAGRDVLSGDNPDFMDFDLLPQADSLTDFGIVHHYGFDAGLVDSAGDADGVSIGTNSTDGSPLVGISSFQNVAGPGLNAMAINDAAASVSADSFSIALWYRADITGLPGGNETRIPRFLNADRGAEAGFGFGTDTQLERTFGGVQNPNNFRVGNSPAGSSPNEQWNHFVLVKRDHDWSYFLNGELTQERSDILPLPDLTHLTVGSVRLGINQPGDRDFNGLIDEFTIFDHALNSAGVRQLFTDPAHVAKLTRNVGDDIIDGGDGNDQFIASAGHDRITDTDGRDSISFENSVTPVSLDLSSTAVQKLHGDAISLQLQGDLERLEASRLSDQITVQPLSQSGRRHLDGADGTEDTLTIMAPDADYRHTHNDRTGRGQVRFGSLPGSMITYENFENVQVVLAGVPLTAPSGLVAASAPVAAGQQPSQVAQASPSRKEGVQGFSLPAKAVSQSDRNEGRAARWQFDVEGIDGFFASLE